MPCAMLKKNEPGTRSNGKEEVTPGYCLRIKAVTIGRGIGLNRKHSKHSRGLTAEERGGGGLRVRLTGTKAGNLSKPT